MRIVSTTCSNTEIVCALGCEQQLVGVDNHSDHPEEVVKNLPRVGPDLGADPEKISALKPDIVLASLTVPGHEKVVQSIDDAGLRYFAPEPTCLEDVYQNIIDIGELLEVPERAESIVQGMKDAIQPTLDTAGKSLLIQWWPKPVIAPGKLSWVNDLACAAGLINPIGERDVKSTPLSDDEVREINPDAVAISWCGVRYEKYRPDVVYRNPAWQNANFVKNRKVFCISEAYLGRPSPRLVKGYKALKELATELAND